MLRGSSVEFLDRNQGVPGAQKSTMGASPVSEIDMNTTQVLPVHHKHCDDLFAAAELAASKGRWVECREAYGAFRREMAAHFATEEEVLFPAFEARSGSQGGPTQMMRLEHGQMNTLMSAGEHAADAADANGFFGTLDTLLIMMQQHNMKEENILYPMCDRALAGHELDLGRALAKRVSGQ
jgi:iron-sulfur cluster repair protein YtfE (RIC family)